MLRRVFFAVLLFVGLAQSALAERRVALVLASEDYKLIRKLDNPVNDARAMEGLLEGLGFEVWLETDRDLKRMRRALDDFRADAKGADVALVFYAGHGVALEGVNYLLPTDADATSSSALAQSSLALSEVQEALAEVAPLAIVLLDACRDDPFATGGSEEGRGAVPLSGDPPEKPPPVPGLGRIGRSDGVLFAFSAAPGETAADGDGDNSPFTAALLRHFGTKGVELKTALTLVQQDVYDRSRGRQLPYIESGLPDLVFVSEKGDLPERDQLLIAMAGLTPELRMEVESLAAEKNMPLAPLYAAIISGDLANASEDERRRLLLEAADSYTQFQNELVKYASDDPRVADLRSQAEEQLTLGAFDAARELLTQAAEIDSTARAGLKENFISRTLSEASTHVLNARAARTDLRYDLAIADLTKAVELYAEVEADLPDADTKFAYNYALSDLGNLQMTAGNLYGALGAFMTQAEFAEARVKETPTDYAWLRELFWSQNGVGMVLQQQGFLSEAEDAYLAAYEVSSKQNTDYPNDPDLQHDLSQALVSIGELRIARNDLAGALSAYQESLSYSLLAQEGVPDNLMLNREVSHAYERVGDVLFMMGSRDEARDAFDAALKVSQSLLQQFPNDPSVKRDLSIRYERLGDAVMAEGDLDAALAAYNESLRIREELQAQDPGNSTRRRDTALMQQRVADVYKAMGDPGTALMLYEQAHAIRAELVKLDPSNMVWTRDLSITHERIGDIYLSEGDPAGALASYEACRDLRMAALALDPGNLPARRDLGLALSKMAQAKVATGDLEAGLQMQIEALTYRRETYNADPTVPIHVIDLYFTLSDVAYVQRDLGDLPAAIASMTETVALVDDMARKEADNRTYILDLAVYARDLTSFQIDAGDYPAAISSGQLAVSAAEQLVALDAGDLSYQYQLMLAAGRLAEAQRQSQDFTNALPNFLLSAQAAYVISAADPTDQVAAADYAASLYWVGATKVALSDFAGARVDLENALALRQWGVSKEPENMVMQRDLAYLLQKLADTYYFENNFDAGRPLEEQALAIMRRVDQTEPGEVGNIIDLVNALDRTASYYSDPKPYFAEALALLEGLQAQGALPEDMVERMEYFRTTVNGN